MLNRAVTVLEHDQPLKKISGDFLSAAEKNDVLGRAARTGNDEELRDLLNNMEGSSCMRLRVYTGDALVLYVTSTGCSCTEDVAVIRRTFVTTEDGNAEYHRAEIRGCYR